MTQAFNLSQLANKVNTSGQLDVSTGLTGTISTSNLPTIPINKGGTNNASLAVTAGGVVYTDGSALQNVGLGTSGYYLQSNGASAPTWTAVSAGGMTALAQATITSGAATYTVSSLVLTSYKFLFINVWSFSNPGSQIQLKSSTGGSSATAFNFTATMGGANWQCFGTGWFDLNNRVWGGSTVGVQYPSDPGSNAGSAYAGISPFQTTTTAIQVLTSNGAGLGNPTYFAIYGVK